MSLKNTFDDPERWFFSKTKLSEETGCLLWIGAKDKDGYGSVVIDGTIHGAHRIAYIIKHGLDSIKWGEQVCHTCDNRGCVNEEHLFKGNAQINSRDMIAKGRGNKAHGNAHPKTVLSDDDVIEIRKMFAAGVSITTLAKWHPKGPQPYSTIYNIVHNLRRTVA